MPITRSQRHQITSLTNQLRVERERYTELEKESKRWRAQNEIECIRLRTQNEMYRDNEVWLKDEIRRLTGGKGKEKECGRMDDDGKGKNDDDKGNNITDFAELVNTFKDFAAKVVENSKTVADYVQANQKAFTTDEAVDKAWSEKLDTLINAVVTDSNSNPPKAPAKTIIIKTVRNMAADWGIGYTSNLAASLTPAALPLKGVKNLPDDPDSTSSTRETETMLSTMATSVASATIGRLATPSTVVTSAASATISRLPTSTQGIVTAVAVAFAAMLLSGALNLGGGSGTEQDTQVSGDGPVEGPDGSADDEDEDEGRVEEASVE